MAIWKFLLDVFREMVGVEGVLVAFQSLSTIKKGTSQFNFLSNKPFLKFYDNSFYKNLICPKDITYNPCPEGCEWGFHPQRPNFQKFLTTLKKIPISKFWLDVLGEIVGLRRGLVALQSLSTIKKGTSPLNFQSNEPVLNFLRLRLL